MSPFIPPYPRPHAGALSLLEKFRAARRNVLSLLQERHYRMKMARFRLPGFDLFVLNDPALVRRVLVEEAEDFPKGKLLLRTLDPVIHNSVFTSNGDEWRRQRRMIDPAFDERGLEELFPLMREAVDGMLARLSKLPPGAEIDANIETAHVTADIICRTICSVPFEREGVAEMFDAFGRYQDAAPSFGLWRAFGVPEALIPVSRRIRRAGRDIRRLVESFVRERYEAYHRGERDGPRDVLAALLEARDPETGKPFPFDELVRHLIVLFIAGHETTAGSLAWAVYALASCPHLQDRVHAEAVEVMGERAPEHADIRKLKLARDTMREALRLYPPVGFLIKEAMRRGEFRGKPVCPGANVIVSPWIIQRHREMWERPDEFDPDRFATQSGKASLKCAYLPFSFGPRVCLGAGFAMQESTLVIASLARRFRVTAIAEKPPEAVSRLTIRSPGGIKLRLEPRAPA